MQVDDEEQGRSWLLILVCVIFAAGFGLAGVVMGVLPLSKLVTDHWQSLDYAQTMGDVVDVRLNAGKDAKQGVSALRVLYTFEVAGKTYQGTRLSVGSGFDENISTFQQTWNSKLQKAMERGQKISVYYDKENPDQSMLDRDMRWGLFAGLLAMATFFPVLGLALLWCGNGLFVTGRLPVAALADVAQWRKRKNTRRRTVASVTPTISPNPAVLGQSVTISFELPAATASVQAMSTMSNRAEITHQTSLFSLVF